MRPTRHAIAVRHAEPRAPLSSDLWRYQLAARPLLLDFPLPHLIPLIGGITSPEPPPPVPPHGDKLLVEYSTSGWLAGTMRPLSCRRDAAAFTVEVQGVGTLHVTPSGERVAYTISDSVLRAEGIFGPGLTLALALQDTWCLHASAIAVDGKVMAFLGDSGAGKSTLARFLADTWARGRRVADDVLPVEGTQSSIVALPHFPQLKLPAAEQVTDPAVELPLRALYLLAPSRDGKAHLQPLGAREATVALVRHTVASRLFDPPLLEKHLAFCALAAQQIPVQRLSYPHRRELLPTVARLLERM